MTGSVYGVPLAGRAADDNCMESGFVLIPCIKHCLFITVSNVKKKQEKRIKNTHKVY